MESIAARLGCEMTGEGFVGGRERPDEMLLLVEAMTGAPAHFPGYDDYLPWEHAVDLAENTKDALRVLRDVPESRFLTSRSSYLATHTSVQASAARISRADEKRLQQWFRSVDPPRDVFL